MQIDKPLTLSRLITLDGVHADADFITDETKQIKISQLARIGGSPSLLRHLEGKTVLLAVPGQLATAVALVQLDGIAKQIILWPHDGVQAHLPAVMASARVDAAVTTWPIPDDMSADDASSRVTANHHARKHPNRETEWVLFTSGTTGIPKMVVHTLRSLCGHLLATQQFDRARPIWCSFYDIRRYGGLQILLRALVGGGSLVLSSAGEAPASFLKRAGVAGATHFLGTPSHWRRALMADAHNAISPIYVRLSGEVADQVILDRLKVAYPDAKLVHAFASTEAGLAFEIGDGRAGFPPDVLRKMDGGPELRLKDGALQVRSPRTAVGRLSDGIHSIADAEGFVDTGDVVEARDGRLYFAGRRDGIVNIGGQKVHPEEVEAIINGHPEVQMSLVRARHSPITGAIVVADVVRRPAAAGHRTGNSAELSSRLENEIRSFCRSRLAPHKVPAAVHLVQSLEIAPTGKLVRRHA